MFTFKPPIQEIIFEPDRILDMKKILLLLCTLFAVFNINAQDAREFVKWQLSATSQEDQKVILSAHATMQGEWYMYAQDPAGDGSLIPPNVVVIETKNVKSLQDVKEVQKYKTKHIAELEFDINYHVHELTLNQTVSVQNNAPIVVAINYMTCDLKTQVCLTPVDDTFALVYDAVANKYAPAPYNASMLQDVVAKADDVNSDTIAQTEVEEKSLHVEAGLEKKSLLEIFIMGLLAGFVAFIMPCIYAMLPITVSFFTKRSKDRATGIKNAFLYSLSIIAIFVAIGALVSILFGPKTMYELSTSMGFNLFVFAIFIIFGVSLLGAFEITLPSSWTSKLDSKANTNSFSGIFFMALVLVLVSFSCTSAFISSLIVYIIGSGNSLGGIVGFFGFGLALALPFSIFALFPSLLNNVAKSGGWLNAIKVTMGFIELAMAMKFLSNVDLQYHWGILNFDVYLCIWIAIFGALTLYLLGFIRFSHDGDMPQNMFGKSYLTVTRTVFAMFSLAFTLYLVPGLWGAPLTMVSGFLPERKTLEFNIHDKLVELQANTAKESALGEHKPKKYTDRLHSEFPGIETYFDYHEALAASKALNKPVLVDFTGHSCVNCRKMERAVLSKPDILKRMRDEFIIVSLYCDDKTKLSESEIITGSDGKKITTLGAKNLELQYTKFNAVAQPLYVFVDSDGNIILNAGGYDPDIDRFHKVMDEVLSKFSK